MLRRWDDPANPPWDGGAFWDEDVVEAGNKRKISDHPGDTEWMCGPVNGVSVYILQRCCQSPTGAACAVHRYAHIGGFKGRGVVDAVAQLHIHRLTLWPD